jgi:hypothetical protein
MKVGWPVAVAAYAADYADVLPWEMRVLTEMTMPWEFGVYLQVRR